MGKQYKGNPPAGALMLEELEWRDIGAATSVTWELYLMPDASTDLWLSLKLCARGKAPNKANYWLGWSRARMQFARNRSAMLLEQNRPMIARIVEQYLDPRASYNGERLADVIDIDALLVENGFEPLKPGPEPRIRDPRPIEPLPALEDDPTPSQPRAAEREMRPLERELSEVFRQMHAKLGEDASSAVRAVLNAFNARSLVDITDEDLPAAIKLARGRLTDDWSSLLGTG